MKRIQGRIRISVISSVFFAFTFFGFAMLELYMSNHEEFWFPYKYMLPVIVLTGILVVGLCLIILMLLPKKCFKYGIALLNGFTLALYIQGNFLPNDYGVLDGTAIEWENYHGRLVYNSIIWCVLILAVILYAKQNEKAFFSVSKIIVGIVFATQLVTLITVGLMLPKIDNNSILSVEGQFEVSKQNNTIVFVLDAFDSGLFCELLQEHPSDIEEIFQDFTFYHNTVGGATRTKYAIPYIFTGRTNAQEESYIDYLEDSFNESPLIKELQTEKYDARVYTEAGYIDMQQEKAIDNIKRDALYPTSKWGLTKDFFKLTLFRYAPHIMKRYFWMYGGDFELWKETNVSYAFNDVSFYEKLKTERVKSTIDQDVFRFYHLTGAHEPYTMNEKCERVDLDKGSEFGQALGALEIVYEYINELKEIGIYENSAIFIMADHGARNYEQNPLFMVKLRGAQQQFQQSEIPLSYKDFAGILTASLTGEEIDFEKDYICLGKRYFYLGREENNNISIIEYASDKEAFDAESFYPTGRIFEADSKKKSYKYRIGQELSFEKEATANSFCKLGFYKNEVTHTWVGKDGCAEMYFELEGKYDNLLLQFEYGIYAPPQEVKIVANGNIIADYEVMEREQKEIVIPSDYIENDVLDLKFEFPDAISPAERKESRDIRKLALEMHSIKLDATDKKFDLENQIMWQYELGTVVTFSEKNNTAEEYCTSGFAEAEEAFTWTDGDAAQMAFRILENEKLNDIVLEYTCRAFDAKQHVILYANDQKIADYDHIEEETKKITIPTECIVDGKLDLRFELPDAKSPKSLGVSEDARKLGLAMKALQINVLE